MVNAPPTLGEAYRLYLPDLVRTLSFLSRSPYALDSSDGMDLVHSFLVDEWEGIVERYDPNRGSFGPYFRRAFALYARRALRQQARNRARFVDPSVLEELAPAASERASPAEVARVEEAISELPASVSALLRTYFQSGSERAAAEALGWSRHRFRTALAEAVARLTLSVGPPGGVSPDDWRVASLVLETGRTPAQAGRLLGLSAAEARERHRRALGTLVSALYAWSR